MGKTIDDYGLDIVISASDVVLVEFAACVWWPIYTVPLRNLPQEQLAIWLVRSGARGQRGCAAKIYVWVLPSICRRSTGDGSVFSAIGQKRQLKPVGIMFSPSLRVQHMRYPINLSIST
jgi:hypothetical protein